MRTGAEKLDRAGHSVSWDPFALELMVKKHEPGQQVSWFWFIGGAVLERCEPISVKERWTVTL